MNEFVCSVEESFIEHLVMIYIPNYIINYTKFFEATKYVDKLVDVKMGSILEVAFAGFCQPSYSSVKGCVRKEDGNKRTLNYLTDIVGRSGHMGKIRDSSENRQFLQKDKSNCHSPSVSSSTEDFKRNLKGCILGAFQTGVALKTNMAKSSVNLYKPPHLKNRTFSNNKLEKTQLDSLGMHPDLTPYNSRLLEKSKQSQSKTCSLLDEVKSCGKRENFNVVVVKSNVCDNGWRDGYNSNNSGLCNVLNKEKEMAQYPSLKKVDNKNTDISFCAQSSTQNSAIDWFDYENKCINSIPICFKTEMDITNAIGKTRKDQHCEVNTESKNQVNSCNHETNTDQIDENTTAKMSSPTGDNQASENGKTKGESNLVLSDCDYKQRCLAKIAGNHKQNETHKDMQLERKLPSLLHVRSSGRKSRPSSKKRRRHKIQQYEHVSNNQCYSKNRNFKPGSGCEQNSSIASILGIDSNSLSMDSHSLPLCSDIDSDSYWSDNDLESDEQYSSIENECMFVDLWNFSDTGTLSLRNFGVTTSVQPKSNSTMDVINQKWNIKESVEPRNTKLQFFNSKKVHFPDDGKIASIHPIVAWSYAYQAARKGPWEQYARDHERFQHRITNVEPLLTPILNTQHRENVYRTRFLGDLP